MHGEEMLRCLESGDSVAAARLWRHAFPHLPLDETKAEACLHLARTTSVRVSFRKRAYSHAWLTERGLPSHLPDDLKPKAERIYPVKVGAVGISVKAPPERAPLAFAIRTAMEGAVLDAYANGDKDRPGLVRSRMLEARAMVYKKLIGVVR